VAANKRLSQMGVVHTLPRQNAMLIALNRDGALHARDLRRGFR
jgi:hypothetical protein